MKISDSDFGLDVRMPIVMLQQQARGEVTTAMMTAMMWLRSWSNWKTGLVERASAGGLRTATGQAFSLRGFQRAMKQLEQMGWITRHIVKHSANDYGVTLHNYKYVDEEGNVHILNPKPLILAPKKTRAQKKTTKHPAKTGQGERKPGAEGGGGEAEVVSQRVSQRVSQKKTAEPPVNTGHCGDSATERVAEGVAESVDKILYKTSLNSSAPLCGEMKSKENPPGLRRARQASLRTTNTNPNPIPIPEPFEADENNRRFAMKNGLNLQWELDGFIALHGSIGNERRNWQAVFRRHLANAVPMRGRIEPPEWVPSKEWTAYLDMRDRIGRSATAYAQTLLVRKLDHLRAAGETVATVLKQSTVGEWTDLYKSGGSPPGQKPVFFATGSALDNLRALEEKYK
jgi:hypothetical protein